MKSRHVVPPYDMQLRFLVVAAVLALVSATHAFDFKLTWDAPPTNALIDVFTTNVTSFASITGFNVYRATVLGNPGTNDSKAGFTLLLSSLTVTNIVQLSNQPPVLAYYYVTWTGPYGESLPSNTNQVFPPMSPQEVTGVKGRR